MLTKHKIVSVKLFNTKHLKNEFFTKNFLILCEKELHKHAINIAWIAFSKTYVIEGQEKRTKKKNVPTT